jgi:hypothetical protein
MSFRLDFGEYAPDQAETDTPVLVTATNVQPTVTGYRPISAPAVYSAALSGIPKGLFLARKANGTFKAFGATTSTLEELVSLTWTNRSGGKTFAVPSGEFAHATQFGASFIVTNYTDGPYVVNVDSGTNFAVLGGSPPKGRTIATVENHLMLGSTDNDDYEVSWSDILDATNWSTGTSGSYSFRRGGRPRRIIPSAGKVIQEEGIYRIVLSTQTDATFEFYELEGFPGTIAPNSAITWGDDVAYLSQNGFWFKGEPIGHEKIARTFFARADDTQIATVLGAADPVRPLFYWIYRENSTDTTYTKGFVYNWLLKKWAELEFDAEFIGLSATAAISPDSWTISPDSESISPDSPLWAGGRPALAVMDTAKKLSFFDGDPLGAIFEMAEMTVGDIVSQQTQKAGGRRAIVRSARPIADTNDVVMDLRTRQRPGDVGSYLPSEVSMTSSGYCHFHKAGRLFRFKVRIPSGSTWSYAKAIDVEANRAGKQ